MLTIKKSLVLGAIALGLSFAASAKEWKEIRVAIDPTYKPFTYKTDDGKPTGFDVDIAQALCDELKAKCVFVEQLWDSMIPACKRANTTPSFLPCQSLQTAKRSLPS